MATSGEMRVLVTDPYYPPETVGSAIWVEQLTQDLVKRGHSVTMLTAMPHFPLMIVFEGFRKKLYMRSKENGVRVIRSWVYANGDKSFKPRMLNWGSFTITSFLAGLFSAPRCDVVYSILWPLPLGVTSAILAWTRGAKLVVNVQDMYPDIAISLGFLKNPLVIRFFQKMEKWIYRHSYKVVVLSEGFKENLLAKGVSEDKIVVVPNWADPDAIQPGPRDNSFREELGVGDRFTVLYSGGLTHNSDLEPVVRAAALLRDRPFAFVICGDGYHKQALTALARELKLENLQFKPFQPLERYPSALQSADITLVTLNNHFTNASVPSKVYKQMAAGRAVLAITAPGSEVDRMIREAGCGLSVPPGDPEALAEAICWADEHRDEVVEMGARARAYLERYHGRKRCVDMIEGILLEACGKRRPEGAGREASRVA